MKYVLKNITPEAIIAAVLLVFLAILPLVNAPRAWSLYVLLFLIYLAMSNMWNLIAGYSGLISLAQPAFIGLAGYCVALSTWVNIPWWAGMLGGVAVAALFAFLMSFAVFRLSGIYFSIGTLVIPEALRILFNWWRPINVPLTGGGAGYIIKNIGDLDISNIYWMALVVAIISIAIIRIVLRSDLGLGLAAIRDNERAAASCGVDTFRIKMYPFIISAAVTGLAGAVFYIYQGYIEPVSTFNVNWTMAILLATVIGGLRTEGGPIVGSIVFVVLYFLLATSAGYSLLIQGIILIVIMLLSPQGLVGIAKKTTTYQKVMGFLGKPLFPVKQ
jgi:branched-chain amino acid transport system permease protein